MLYLAIKHAGYIMPKKVRDAYPTTLIECHRLHQIDYLIH